jgi:hypothetical protein
MVLVDAIEMMNKISAFVMKFRCIELKSGEGEREQCESLLTGLI